MVTSLVAPPAAPVGLQAFRNGTGVLISWQPGRRRPAAGYNLRVGTRARRFQLQCPDGRGRTRGRRRRAGGNYYLAVSAVNAGGVSAEATSRAGDAGRRRLRRAAGAGADRDRLGQFLTATWAPVPGAARYLFSYNGPGFAGTQTFNGGDDEVRLLRPAAWHLGVRHPGTFCCGDTLAPVGGANLVVDGSTLKHGAARPGSGRANAAQLLPLPNKQAIVNSIAAQSSPSARLLPQHEQSLCWYWSRAARATTSAGA